MAATSSLRGAMKPAVDSWGTPAALSAASAGAGVVRAGPGPSGGQWLPATPVKRGSHGHLMWAPVSVARLRRNTDGWGPAFAYGIPPVTASPRLTPEGASPPSALPQLGASKALHRADSSGAGAGAGAGDGGGDNGSAYETSGRSISAGGFSAELRALEEAALDRYPSGDMLLADTDESLPSDTPLGRSFSAGKGGSAAGACGLLSTGLGTPDPLGSSSSARGSASGGGGSLLSPGSGKGPAPGGDLLMSDDEAPPPPRGGGAIEAGAAGGAAGTMGPPRPPGLTRLTRSRRSNSVPILPGLENDLGVSSSWTPESLAEYRDERRARAIERLLAQYRCEKAECQLQLWELQPPVLERQTAFAFKDAVEVKCPTCGDAASVNIWY